MPQIGICITNLGITPLGGLVDIFASPNPSFSYPLFSNIPISGMTGDSCPYIITVPAGTTQIRVRDNITGCAVDMPVKSNDICIECNFGFSNIVSNVPARPIVGELTGTCQNPITDYRIFWYGPDDPTNLAFTSGKGSLFAGYDYAHPLTTTTSPLVFAGTYKPIVDKVRINSINFTQTASTGAILAELDCLRPLTVTALTCDSGVNFGVGTWPFSAYTHRIFYTANPGALPPKVTRSTFKISNNTNIFAYRFDSFSVWDELKITYSGANYSTPIVLENIRTNQPNWTLSPTAPIRSITTSVVQKILPLTGFSRNPADFLLLEVTPNPANETTSWDFCFTCLTGFTEGPCFIDNNTEQVHYKIISSSVTGFTQLCCGFQPFFRASGCSQDDFIEPNDPTNLYNYVAPLNRDANRIRNFFPTTFQNFWGCQRNEPGFPGGNGSCLPIPPNNNTIIFAKTIDPLTNRGNMNLQFSNYGDFLAYYTGWTLALTVASGTPFQPNRIEYFRSISLFIPDPRGRENQRCGDGWSNLRYWFHPSSQVTTGTTSTGWTMNLTMPAISATSINLWTGGTESWDNLVITPSWTNGGSISASTGSNFTGSWTINGNFSGFTDGTGKTLTLSAATLTSPIIPPGWSSIEFCTLLENETNPADLEVYDGINLLSTISYSATSAGTPVCFSINNSGICRDSTIILKPTNNGIFTVGSILWRQNTCNTCRDQLLFVTGVVNNSSTATTNNISGTTFRGARLVTPWTSYIQVFTAITSTNRWETTLIPQLGIYSTATFPMSGNPLTFIPSLSANSIPQSSWSVPVGYDIVRGDIRYTKVLWNFRIDRPLGSITQYYDIWTIPQTNYLFSGTPSINFNYNAQPFSRFIRIGFYSAGTLTVLRPEYFVP